METFENYEELLKYDKKAALELLKDKGGGDWQEEEIYYHESLYSFAEYEVYEGWYSDTNLDRDYDGAPNLTDFIDFESLGVALSRTWDDSVFFKTENNKVLSTNCGW